MDNTLNLFNTFFAEQGNTTLVQPFIALEKKIVGKVSISTSKSTLNFEVEVSSFFPFSDFSNSCVKFKCKELEGYPHINSDFSVCIHTPPDANPEQKLEKEWLALIEWIDYFYIQEKNDEQYNYLSVDNYAKSTINILFQNTSLVFKKNQLGVAILSSWHNHVCILTQIDNQKIDWSNKLSNHFECIYIFIEQEPVLQRRKRVQTWKELANFLDNRNLQTLYHLFSSNKAKNEKKRLKLALLLIGYYISSKDNSKEIHWDCIELDFEDFPIKKEGDKRVGFYLKCLEKSIKWHKTANISYNRFFGRGKLSDKMTEKNIAIIGVGAIGSNVAKILARGGVKKLSLIDYDIVESGNICRSEYQIEHIGIPKVFSLAKELIDTSPFIEVEMKFFIEKYLRGTQEFEDNKKLLNEYHYIFDCSTDNEMLYMLEIMGLSHKVINLSITNHAQELICIAGERVSENKRFILEDIQQEDATYYEGAGCQYPTFQASYIDIQSLLGYAFQVVHYQVDNGINLTNFILKPVRKEMGFEITKNEFHKYFQKELNLYLIISDEQIKQIQNLSLQHYPNEFGGILIGSYTKDDCGIFITEIKAAQKYKNSINRFTLYSEGLNEYLENLHTEGKGSKVYVGEWHTHPNGTANYSQIDFETIKKTAEEPYIYTDNPILLINGFSLNQHDFIFYVYHHSKLYAYEKI